MKRKPSTAFPLESIFPGIHKERPDIAAREAEQFLAYGHKDGFDLENPEIRAQFVDCPPEKFGEFEVKPTPAIRKQLEQLPEDWEHRPQFNDLAMKIADGAAAYYKLPAHLMCIIVNGRCLYVEKRPDTTPKFRPRTRGR